MKHSRSKIKSYFTVFLLSIFLVPFQNCGPTTHTELSEDLGSSGLTLDTYTDLNNAIFKTSCLPCHGSGDPKIDFSTHSALISSSKFSELYSAIDSGEMPQGAPRLSDEKIAAVFSWLQIGAPNN